MLILPQATVLGPLEHAVMRIVWAHAAPITVKHVFEALSADRDVAYTTVMTTMVRLAEKGMLTRAPCRLGAQRGRGHTTIREHVCHVTSLGAVTAELLLVAGRVEVARARAEVTIELAREEVRDILGEGIAERVWGH
jgi:hypothetical protein